MATSESAALLTRFSTADIAERERVSAWCDYWGQRVFGTAAEPTTDAPFAAEVSVRNLSGLRVLTTDTSPIRVIRSSESAKDGRDCLGLVVCSRPIAASQAGREISLRIGDATLLSTGDASVLESHQAARFRCILVDRHMLPLAPDRDRLARDPISSRDPLLRLLLSYLDIVLGDASMGEDELNLAGVHMRDLLGLLIGKGGDARHFSTSIRVAALARLRRFVAANYHDPGLSIQDAARRFDLSVRQIQRLFAADDTSFRDYLLEQRLNAVYRTLTDFRQHDRRISDIAWQAGFNDISYFNRCFRKRYGASPSEMRQNY